MGIPDVDPLQDANKNDSEVKTNKSYGILEKQKILRDNVTQVLERSTLMPFRWLKNAYRCFYCYDIFQQPKYLKEHQEIHKTEEIAKKMKSFLDPAVNVDVSRISCKLCPDKIEDLNSLVDHLIETHGIDFNKSIGICMSPYVLNDISVSCAICQGVYQTFGRLLFHTNKYHSNPLDVLCDFCGNHFTTNQRLKEHINNKHDHKTVKCRLCDDKIVPSKIRTHMQRVHGKKYKCSSCTEVFETHYKRTAHMMIVHKNKEKIKCPQCPLEFVFQSAMMTHVRRSHMLEKNAVCGVCGWQCFESSRLQTHMLKHSNERPFVCSDCGKAFKTKKGLKRHCETLHLAVKPNLRPPKLSL